MPFSAQMAVEVADVVVPKSVRAVKGYAKAAPPAPQVLPVPETRPAISWRHWVPVKLESVNPLAPETVRAVVEAYGNDEAVVDVEVKYPARAKLPRSDEPLTDRVVHGELVPMPTSPFAANVVLAIYEVDEA